MIRGKGAVIIGAHVNALTTARALSEWSIPIVVVQTRVYDFAHRSRAVASSESLLDFPSRPESLLDLLEFRRSQWPGWALYPTDDAALELLLEHQDTLERSYRLMVPPRNAANVLLHKDQTALLAERLGVPRPSDLGDIQHTNRPAKELRSPVVIKPNLSHLFRERFGKKAFLVHTAEQLERRRKQLAESGIQARVVDWIPGPDSMFFNYSLYMTATGEPMGGLAMRKERKSPPFFGVCRVAHTQVRKERAKQMEEKVVAMLREISYRGMANAEFKLDRRDGELRCIEINARPFLMQGLPLRAGLSYARMAWQDHMLGEPPTARDNGWRGAWIHLHADIGNALAYRRQEQLAIREYLRPYRMPRTYAVWSCRDPAPFFSQWSRSAVETTGRLLRYRSLDTPERLEAIRP